MKRITIGYTKKVNKRELQRWKERCLVKLSLSEHLLSAIFATARHFHLLHRIPVNHKQIFLDVLIIEKLPDFGYDWFDFNVHYQKWRSRTVFSEHSDVLFYLEREGKSYGYIVITTKREEIS